MQRDEHRLSWELGPVVLVLKIIFARLVGMRSDIAEKWSSYATMASHSYTDAAIACGTPVAVSKSLRVV
jgi:hypothetical protein